MNKALICAAAVIISAFAYSQDWQRAAFFNMMQTPSDSDLDLSFQKLNESDAAAKRGDWDEAKDAYLWLANRSSSLETDVNRASNFLSASMCAWNLGDSDDADEYLGKAIDKMRYGDNLGGGCEARAVAFRAKLRAGKWPRRFTYADMNYDTGVHTYIMAPVNDRFHGRIRASIARSDAIGGMADAQRGVYEAQGRWQERQAKFSASREYREATGRTFDPSDPPSRGTSAREKWDAAKRIYDIFDN